MQINMSKIKSVLESPPFPGGMGQDNKIACRCEKGYVVFKQKSNGRPKSIAIWSSLPWGYQEDHFDEVVRGDEMMGRLRFIMRFIDDFFHGVPDKVTVTRCLKYTGVGTTPRYVIETTCDIKIVLRQFSPTAGYVKLTLDPDTDEWSTQTCEVWDNLGVLTKEMYKYLSIIGVTNASERM